MSNIFKKLFAYKKVKIKKRYQQFILERTKRKYFINIFGMKFLMKTKFQERFRASKIGSGTRLLLRIPVNHKPKCTYGNMDIEIVNRDTTIGNFCSFGRRVVLGHGIHPINFLSTSPYFYLNVFKYQRESMPMHEEFLEEIPPIHIGNDVWIGDGVFVKNGITIGDGAIIGARVVVTKDIPPYAIAVGNPAKVIRYRFDAQTIKDLLETKWWDLPDDIIKQIPYENIEDAVKFIKNIREQEKIN